MFWAPNEANSGAGGLGGEEQSAEDSPSMASPGIFIKENAHRKIVKTECPRGAPWATWAGWTLMPGWGPAEDPWPPESMAGCWLLSVFFCFYNFCFNRNRFGFGRLKRFRQLLLVDEMLLWKQECRTVSVTFTLRKWTGHRSWWTHSSHQVS